MFGFTIIKKEKLKKYKEYHSKYTDTYNKYIQYKLAYEDCRNVLDPDDRKPIDSHLKELGVI